MLTSRTDQTFLSRRPARQLLASLRLAALPVLAVISSSASAAGVEDCKDALVRSSIQRNSSSSSDFRLAQYVSESVYNEHRSGAAGSVPIYGVPVGGSYTEFKKNVQRRIDSTRQSLSSAQASNYMWIGLDPKAPSAYADCLRATTANRLGIHLLPVSATVNEVTVTIRWNPMNSVTEPVLVSWRGIAANLANLPRSISRGDTTVVLRRPQAESTLVINTVSLGLSDTLVITPFVQPPHEPERVSLDYSGRMQIETQDTVPFNFTVRQADSTAGNVTNTPWTFTAPRAGQLSYSVRFDHDPTGYVSCALHVAGKTAPLGYTHTSNAPDISACAFDGTMDVEEGQRIQVMFGHALPWGKRGTASITANGSVHMTLRD